MFTPALSPRQGALRYEINAAPVIKVVQKYKDEPAKLAEFRTDLEQLVEIYFNGKPAPAGFLDDARGQALIPRFKV